MTKNKILIVSGDAISGQMGGVGVRYYEIARALSKKFQVTLAAPNQPGISHPGFEIQPYDRERGDLRTLAKEADALIVHGFVLHFHPYLKDMGRPLAVDLYVPNLLESLVWHKDDEKSAWIPAYEEYLRVQLELLRAGDFFFCASETQRDYWLGWLHAQKRINPHTFQDDPALRRLIDIVPFGVPIGAPEHKRPVLKGVLPGIEPDDKVILWSGGLWDWLDPLTLVHAMHILQTQQPDLKVFFMGTTHPDPVVNGMKMPAQVIELARSLGLYNQNVFFGDWIPYAERENYLAEADLAAVTHPDHIETHFSFRTRILDCIWAGLPVVTTQGGGMADWVEKQHLGVTVPPQDPAALADAIRKVARQGKQAYAPAFQVSREHFRWENVVEPLEKFLLHPNQTPDKGHYLTELERIVSAKDAHFKQVVADKDAFINQVIADKDAFLQQVIADKDEYTNCVIADKDAFLQRVAAEKDAEIDRLRCVLERPENSPFISIITVNYNGKHYLAACLDALRQQNYPQLSYEVIVSDNGSSDGSVEFLQTHYPWVRLLENKQNLGFASGNNVAIQAARGDFIILLNNDTAPDRNFIRGMVDTARADERTGLVTGHLRLFYDQLEVEIRTHSFVPENDGRELGIQVFKVDTGVFRGVVQYLDGFHGTEPHYSGTKFRWTKGEAVLGVPVPHEGTWKLNLTLAASRPDNKAVSVQLLVGGQVISSFDLVGGDPQDFTLEIPDELHNLARPLQQNTGSIVFRNGAGRDRGTYVRSYETFFEVDEGQYGQREEVFAGCGASLLLRRIMLDDVGLLDDDLFMYYEDTDLSWRARLRGWKVVYSPDALVRHIHCGTSPEWSPWFYKITERNRLAMVFKNGSLRQVGRVWGGFVWLALRNMAAIFWLWLSRRPEWRQNAGQTRMQISILWTLLRWQPMLWRKRWQIQRSAKRKSGQLESWFLEVRR